MRQVFLFTLLLFCIVNTQGQKTNLSKPVKSKNTAISKDNLNLNKFDGVWQGQEADQILLKVKGNSILVYYDYGNDANKDNKGFKCTPIDNNTFETQDINGKKSTWHLSNNVITLTTKGEKPYKYRKV